MLVVGRGGPAGQALCYVLAAEWVPRELYISRVGTARSARGLGYAAWVLSTAIASAFESGFVKVVLTVDTQSPTGATVLYERLGFSVVRQGAIYRKTVPAR